MKSPTEFGNFAIREFTANKMKEGKTNGKFRNILKCRLKLGDLLRLKFLKLETTKTDYQNYALEPRSFDM